MLNFVASAFRTLMSVVLFLILIGFAVGGAIVGGLDWIGQPVLGFIVGAAVGLIVAVLFGGLIANFLNMVDNTKRLVDGEENIKSENLYDDVDEIKETNAEKIREVREKLEQLFEQVKPRLPIIVVAASVLLAVGIGAYFITRPKQSYPDWENNDRVHNQSQPSNVLVNTSVKYVNSPSTGHLNIRAEPNANAELLFSISHGTRIDVGEIVGAGPWVKLELDDGGIGYLNGRFLSDTPPAAIAPTNTQTPPPAATTGGVNITGSRSMASVRRVVMQNMGALRHAYNRRLRENPNLSGTITIRFTIDEFGNVTSATQVNSTIGDPELERIVLERVRSFVFERSDTRGDVTTVTYPFQFTR